VNEVNVETLQLGLELRESIQSLLSIAPVVLLPPVFTYLLQIGEGGSLGPVVDGFRLGETRIGEALFQVVELFVGDVDFEGGDLAHGISGLHL